jgi:hypothetical protein
VVHHVDVGYLQPPLPVAFCHGPLIAASVLGLGMRRGSSGPPVRQEPNTFDHPATAALWQ